MQKSADQNALIFQMSLTEIILLFVFILLIVIVIFENQLETYKYKNERLIAALGNNASLLNVNTGIDKQLKSSENIDILEFSNEVMSELKNIIQKKINLKDEWSNFELYRQYVKDNRNIPNLLQKLDERTNELDIKNDTLDKCKANVENIRRRCGTGFPSCELDKDGKTIFLLDITLYDESIGVDFLNNKTYSTATYSVPDNHMSRNMSFIDANQLFKKYWKWSKEQELECRFMVKVYDEADIKDSYKKALSIVEKSFYKKEIKKSD